MSKKELSAEVYTDGGCRPNPGVGGWGFYYTDSEGKAIAGCGFVGEYVTNNTAELVAATQGLTYALENQVVTLKILSDSKYVINGTNYLNTWAENDYCKRDGEPLANQNEWKEYHEVLKRWCETNKNPPVYEWVRGHSGIEGNEIADRFANRAIIQYGKGVIDPYFEEIGAKKEKIDVKPLHNLVSGNRWYFKTNVPHQLDDGRFVYISAIYERPNKEEQVRNKNIGKRAADSHLALTVLKENIPILDGLKAMFDNAIETEVAPVVANVDFIRRKNVWEELNINEHRFTELKGLLAVLPCSNPIAERLHPPRLVFKLEDNIQEALKIFSLYQKESDLVKRFDITPLFIEKNEKGKQKIAKTFTMPTKEFLVKNVELRAKRISVKLNVGIDLPIRNRFSGLLKTDDKTPVSVEMVIWDFDDSLSYRVGVVIKQGDDIGFYLSPDSNLRLIMAKK